MLILFFIILLILLCLFYFKDNRIYIKSNIDNNKYLVNKTGTNEDKIVANILAQVSRVLNNFVNNLVKKYPNNKQVQRLRKRFNKNKIVETNKYENLTAYTLSKGKILSLCVRSKYKTGNNEYVEDKNLYDLNILIYVSIHELAHVMSVSIGHNTEFYKNFEFLLKNAIDMNIYSHVNYKKNPQDYCGLIIDEKIL